MGNGHIIGVTTHKWLPECHPLFKDATPLADVRIVKVHQLILSDNQGWNFRKINILFETSTTRNIKNIELPDSSTTSDV